MRIAAPLITAALAAALLTPGAAQADSDVSATAAAKKSRTSVTLKIGATKVNVADSVPAKITVTPSGKRTVRIQTRSKTNTWETVKKAKTNASGVLKTSFTTYKSGDWKVRAVVDETKQRAGATSSSKSLKSGYPAFGDPPTQELDPIKPGSLTVKQKATTNTGEFRVKVTKSGVTVTDGAGRTAWASAPDKAFLTATRSTLRWFQRSTAGAYWAQVDRGAKLLDQTISSVSTSAGGQVRIKGTVKGGGKKAYYTLTMQAFQAAPDVSVLQLGVTFNDKKSDVKVNSIQLTSGRGSDKAVHGFGNQYQGFDLSGQVLPILVQEQGVTRGQMPAAGAVDQATWGAGNLQTTYGGWPTYVTEENRSFGLTDRRASGAFSIADMRRAKQISLESFADTMYADVVARDTPRALMAARGAGVTRPVLSESVQRGAVLGLQGGTDKVRQVVTDMQAAGTKVDAVWLQDWVGKRTTVFGQQLWWTWQLNTAWYPGWNQMVADFKAQDIDVLTYVNPFVINQDEVDGVPIRNLYKEGEQKGFLVKNQVGDTYVVETIGFPTALVDLTNPAARDWFAGVIAEQVIGVGATGFMADFAEYTPFDSVLDKGSAAKQHSRWPQLWADTVKEACKRGGVPDCVAFFRSSYLGSPKSAPLMWAGDQMVNYAIEDGMANAVQGMLAGGVSGAPLVAQRHRWLHEHQRRGHQLHPTTGPECAVGGDAGLRRGHAHPRDEPSEHEPAGLRHPGDQGSVRARLADLRSPARLPQDRDRRGGRHRCPGDATRLAGPPGHEGSRAGPAVLPRRSPVDGAGAEGERDVGVGHVATRFVEARSHRRAVSGRLDRDRPGTHRDSGGIRRGRRPRGRPDRGCVAGGRTHQLSSAAAALARSGSPYAVREPLRGPGALTRSGSPYAVREPLRGPGALTRSGSPCAALDDSPTSEALPDRAECVRTGPWRTPPPARNRPCGTTPERAG
jgi:alpha-glucosidase